MDSAFGQYLKGIDLSHWNGSVDFRQVRLHGIEVVMLKATEGTNWTDPCLDSYYCGAKKAGLKVGFYHFFLPEDRDNARRQAAHFARQTAAYTADCRYVLDVEANRHNLPPAMLQKAVVAFIEYFKEITGHTVMLYASHIWLANQLAGSDLYRYPVWIAQWTEKAEPDKLKGWPAWTGWQYSCEGRVPGIKGKVDLNLFTKEVLIKKGDVSN